MKRRAFISLLCGASVCWPDLARGQTGQVPRVGVLWHAGSAEAQGAYYTAVVEGFRDLGYAEGRNIVIEHRFANEMPERFGSMATELIALNVDVLMTVGPQTAPYATAATM